MPVMITCGGCDAQWSGTSKCHCGGCHQTFSGIGLFDLHRVNDECKDPKGMKKDGLPLKYEDGVWKSSIERPQGIGEVK